ncbi:transposase [Streptomyces sp. NPDC000188]|uniref:transposase n=1 Tax=Streptomyces sp. NPDC000188 TaxID=3154245 RepID=UPI00331AE85E
MVRRHELSDVNWELSEPLLPPASFGQPRLDDRTVLNGIVWKAWAQSTWAALWHSSAVLATSGVRRPASGVRQPCSEPCRTPPA